MQQDILILEYVLQTLWLLSGLWRHLHTHFPEDIAGYVKGKCV